MADKTFTMRVVLDGDKAQASLDKMNTTTTSLTSKIVDFGVKGGVAFFALKSAITGVYNGIQGLLDATLEQKRAQTLSKLAFKDSTDGMLEFASSMQKVTNHGDELLLPLMAKLKTTYKLTSDEIQQLTPLLLDFADANAATGMSVSSAFDLMGRAVNGNTSMLGRYGIELDKTRLAEEGVSYLTEKLAEDYKGTATALADVRLQTANAFGDLKEEVGKLLTVAMSPFVNKLLEATYKVNDFFESMQGSNLDQVTEETDRSITSFEMLTGRLRIMGDVTEATDEKKETFKETLIQLQEAYGPYIGSIDTTITKYDDLIKRINDAREAMIKEAGQKMAYAKSQDYVQKIVEERNAIRDKYDEIAQKQKEFQTFDEEHSKKMKSALMNAPGIVGLLGTKYQTRLDAYNVDVKRLEDNIAKREGLIVDHNQKITDIEDNFARAFNVNNDSEKVKQATTLNEKLKVLDEEYARSQREGLVLQLEEEKANFKQASDDEVELKVSTYRKIKELEIAIAALDAEDAKTKKAQSDRDNDQAKTAEIQRLRSLKTIKDSYSASVIADKLKRTKKELSIEREAKLQEARDLKASKETLDNIRKTYEDKEDEVVRNHNLELAREAKSKYAKLRKQDEDYWQFQQLQLAQEDPYQAQLNAQLRALDNFFAKKHDNLIASGVTEEEITKAHNDAKKNLEEQSMEARIANGAKGLGQMANTIGQFGKEGFEIAKALNIAQVVMETPAAAFAAFKSLQGIPLIGPALGAAAAAAAVAQGALTVKQIAKSKPPKAEKGGLSGLLAGPSHANGGILIEAEGDEYITREKRVKELGVPFFDFINNAPLSQLKERFSGLSIPNVPMASVPSVPQFAYASGGAVSSGSGLMEILIEKVEALTEKLENKKMVVNTYVSANEVIEKADNVLINESSENGSKERSRW